VSVEERLYVVMRESVGTIFANYAELAAHIHQQEPTPFLYNRLGYRYCMQVKSIVPYVSLGHALGVLRSVELQGITSISDEGEEPDEDGARELIAKRSIDKLLVSGFSYEKFALACRRLFKAPHFVVPSQHEIYRSIALDMSEPHFIALTSMGRVREHFGFSIVSRRVMVPTPKEKSVEAS
jgi:hypothetical protein